VERESLLATLIILLGGLSLQLFALWRPSHLANESAARRRERALWLALWWPVAPALTVAAWLCGWALSQPDPVPNHVGRLIFIATAPFAIVGLRALLRAAWSLRECSHLHGILTVGLLRPRIVVARELARALDERALQAALAHERMHVRHRDPLRIWLGQIVTDLQWPWPSAQRRFMSWLEALELARDDEARTEGVAGADLAAAVLGSLRFHLASMPAATLTGSKDALPVRITRLLNPLPESAADSPPHYISMAAALAITWVAAAALGLCFGERLIGVLLKLSS
jgi:hypothetical protein